jgi:hypothetical protein
MKNAVRLACLVLFTLATALFSFGQTGSTTVVGGGILSWNYTSHNSVCGTSNPGNIPFTEFDFSGFVYNGQSLSGTAAYIDVAQVPGCPPQGPEPTGGLTLAGSDFTITFFPQDGGSGSATIISTISGFINPKFVILGVTYAPPGNQSFVQYANSSTQGTSTSYGMSFTSDAGYAVSLSSTRPGKFTIPNIGGDVGWSLMSTKTFSQDFTNEADSSSSIALSSSSSWITKVPGPFDPYAGVNHDFDVIWIWLNPLLNFTIQQGATNSTTWTGYSFDADDVPEMDIYGVYLGWLDGHLSTPGPASSDPTPLERIWAGNSANEQVWPAGTSPALDDTDFAMIAAQDPFSDPNYRVTVPSTPAGNITSSDGRYTLTGNQIVDYEQPGPGGQPFNQVLTESTTSTQTAGQGVKKTYKTSYSKQQKFTGSLFDDTFSKEVTDSSSLSTTNQWSVTNDSQTGTTATGSVTGPPCVASGTGCSPVYIGPTEFEVFKDNIYGTYLFYPVGATLQSVTIAPADASITKGATQQFTATGNYSDGSTKNLTSAMAWTSSNTAAVTISSSGLATGVTGGSTTIQATSSIVSGSTTLTVQVATLISLAVTPANSSVAKGSTKQYTATGTYSDNSTQNLTGSVVWTSSNTGVASITTGGLATGVAAGTATIQATLGSVAGSTGLTVTTTTTPSITTISPASGPEGTLVTVTGTNFGATQGTSVIKFNGLVASVTTWSNTQITVAVPRGATTGNVAVLVNGVASNGKTFTVSGALTITTVAPTSGPEGTLVTVTGTNFGATQGTSTIKFNGLVATPTTWSNTKITVAVPKGATTGNVAVLVNKVATNGITFTVTGALTITSISPTAGAVGATVTITGTNFGSTRGTSTVKFNGKLVATYTSWSATSIKVVVPSGATTGNVVVLVNGVASNGQTFTVQ